MVPALFVLPCELRLSFSWGDKFPAKSFVKFSSIAEQASESAPIYLDIGKHVPTPGHIPLFLGLDEKKGRIRQGTNNLAPPFSL